MSSALVKRSGGKTRFVNSPPPEKGKKESRDHIGEGEGGAGIDLEKEF